MRLKHALVAIVMIRTWVVQYLDSHDNHHTITAYYVYSTKTTLFKYIAFNINSLAS